MPNPELFTVSELTRRLNKRGNRKLIRGLIKTNEIPHYKLGRGMALDEKGIKALGKALHNWESRRSPYNPDAAIAS